MYHSPDTPLHVKRIQQQIWMSKTMEERLQISLQMIEDARLLQIQGLKMRYPLWAEEDIHIYRLQRLVKNYPNLVWMQPIIEDLKQKRQASNSTIA
ncbi:MAG: hypothetical protein RLZZ628_2742 [Bacteroidota bacterium]|jgi:uncharacterized protein with von Willebrand factor type A (vWA) domain